MIDGIMYDCVTNAIYQIILIFHLPDWGVGTICFFWATRRSRMSPCSMSVQDITQHTWLNTWKRVLIIIYYREWLLLKILPVLAWVTPTCKWVSRTDLWTLSCKLFSRFFRNVWPMRSKLLEFMALMSFKKPDIATVTDFSILISDWDWGWFICSRMCFDFLLS